MISTECDGVTFFEGFPSHAEKGEEISTVIGGVFRSAQLTSLRDVKTLMAIECRRLGGNAIVGFSYGQKSVGFLSSLVSRDDVQWYGKGYLANITTEILS